MTILVVDDNSANLLMACDLLTYLGHTVLRADGAEGAQQILKESPLPDMILMDIQMPGMDGLTLTRKLKVDPAYKDIHIVALTAHAMYEEKAIASGCDGYIAKPFEPRTFNTTLLEIFN